MYYSSNFGTFPNFNANTLVNFDNTNRVTAPTFSINFSEDQSAAAFAMATNPGTSTFTALLDGAVLESFSTATTLDDSNNFYGFSGIMFDEISVAPGGFANQMSLDNIQTQASATAAVPFEFSPTLGLLLAGGLWGGSHLHRKHRAKKVVLTK